MKKIVKLEKIYYIISFLIILLIGVRLALFDANKSFSWDEAIYLSHADGIIQSGQYGYVGQHPVENFRPPLFSLLLSTSFLFGVNYLYAKIFAVLISILSIVVTYVVTCKLFDKKVALLTTLFVATNPLHLFFSFRILTEILSVILLFLSVYIFFIARKNFKLLPLFGFLMGLSVLTRYNLISVGTALIIYMIAFERKTFVKMIKSSYFHLAIVIFLITILPWLIYLNFSKNSITTQTEYFRIFSYLRLPLNYFTLSVVLAGLVAPFVIYGSYRILKDRRHPWFLILIILFLFYFINGFVLMSLRYLVPIVGLLGISAVYSLTILNRKFLYIFIILSLLNAVFGYLIVLQYNTPLLPLEKLPDEISRKSFFEANVIRKNAAEIILNSTDKNDIIVTDAPAWLWVYTHRNWVWMADTENEYKNLIAKYDVKYVYMEPSAPKWLYNYSKTVIMDNEFIQLFKT